MRYMSELERKIQTLQTEATTLAAQLSLLQVVASSLHLLLVFLLKQCPDSRVLLAINVYIHCCKK